MLSETDRHVLAKRLVADWMAADDEQEPILLDQAISYNDPALLLYAYSELSSNLNQNNFLVQLEKRLTALSHSESKSPKPSASSETLSTLESLTNPESSRLGVCGTARVDDPSFEEWQGSRKLVPFLDQHFGEFKHELSHMPGFVYTPKTPDACIWMDFGAFWAEYQGDEFSSANLQEVEEWLYFNLGYKGPNVWNRRAQALQGIILMLMDLVKGIDRKEYGTPQFTEITQNMIMRLNQIRNGHFDDKPKGTP